MISRTAGWLTLFMIGTDLFVMSPLLPQLARGLGASVPAAGWAVTVFALAYLVGGPSLGALADRGGRYAVLTAALAVFTAGNLATALAPSLALLLAARAVVGLAASGITPSIYALVSASAPEGKRATWLAVVTSGLLLALATGAPAGSLLSSVLGWRQVFACLTGAGLLVLLMTGWYARRARQRPAAPQRTPPPGPPPGERPPLLARLRAVTVTTLWALALYGLYTYLGAILVRRLALPAGLVSAALVCFGAGAVAGNLGGGRLADRLGGRAVCVLSLLALAAAQLLFGVTVHAGTAALLVTLVVMALAAYPFFTAQQLRLVAGYPAVSGSLIAWNNSAMYAGILAGSALGGPLLAGRGPSALAFACAAIAAAGALAAARRIA